MFTLGRFALQTLLLLFASTLAGLLFPAWAAPPEFVIKPAGDEHAFVNCIYKAVLVVADGGCAKPQIVIDHPAGAIYEDETFKYLPTGSAGDSFQVRVRAINADGEDVVDWTVTLVDSIHLDFENSNDFTDYFEPRLENVPDSQLDAELGASTSEGDLLIHVPSTGEDPEENLDSWCGFDRSPRWWSKLRVFGAFEVETRLYFPFGLPGNPTYGYHAGLAIDRGKEDLTIHGMIRDRIEFERTCRWDGDYTYQSFFPGASSEQIYLRIVVNGKKQTYWARRSTSDPWTLIGSVYDPRPPIQGIGLAVKTWADQRSFTAGLQYFRYRGLAPEPPELQTPEGDYAFSGGEYCFPVTVRSDLPVVLQVKSPPTGSIDDAGLLTCPVQLEAGNSFVATVQAVSDAGETTRSWEVRVVRPVRHEFNKIEEFTANFFDPGTDTSSRRDEINAIIKGGQLAITLPAAPEEDFDSWCGYDRSPRWLHRARVTGNYAVETSMTFLQPPPQIADMYHVGLAADRGWEDLALLGAIRTGVEYERTCSKDCENTGTVFPGEWTKTGQRFFLRMESLCDEQLFLARREADADWTVIAGAKGRRPRPAGIGIGMKNWGNQGAFTIGYDFFEYGPRGVLFIEVPQNSQVLAGSLYTARVKAQGVNPRYSLLSPAGGSIDSSTGEITYQVPADAAQGSTIDFEARAGCGLDWKTASWTLTVTKLEPPVEIASITPAQFSYLGKTQFTITGANFTENTEVIFTTAGGPVKIQPTFASSSILQGTVPPNDPGLTNVTVTDPVRGEDTISNAGAYIGPFDITHIFPYRALAGDQVAVTIRGAGFTGDTAIKVGTQALLDQVCVDPRTITGILVVPPAGPTDVLYTVSATDHHGTTGDPVDDSIPNGFTALAPLEVDSITPSEISYLGKTSLEIRGRNFTGSTKVIVGGLNLSLTSLTSTKLTVTPLAHAPGAVTVAVEDPERGSDELPDALTYIGPLQVTGIDPNQATVHAPVSVIITGVGFTPQTAFKIGGEELLWKEFLSAKAIRTYSPDLPVGTYDVTATDLFGKGQIVTATLPQAFEITEEILPPILTSVTPHDVSFQGGTPVSIKGKRFREDTVILFGTHELLGQVFVSESRITGLAPPLDAGEPAGPRHVFATHDGKTDVLEDGIFYFTRRLLAPDEIEGNIADGMVRYSWHNPEQYDEILLLNEDGTQVVRVLDGNDTSVEMDIGDAVFSSHHKIQGSTLSFGKSDPSDAHALVAICEERPPLTGTIPGKIQFSLFGGNEAKGDLIQRCQAGVDNDLMHYEDCCASSSGSLDTSSPIEGMTGALFTGRKLFEELNLDFIRVFTTGFTLLKDATALEIAGYYAKTDSDFGLSLRGYLRRVTPDDRSFEDEFTFPDTALGKDPDWHQLTYFRANRDLGAPVGPGDTFELCGLPIPAGDYLLDVYAVGGELDQPYFVFANDSARDYDPLLFPGSPCPPYPMVKVTDLSGQRTLPTITRIEPLPGAYEDVYGVHVSFQAFGTWLEADGVTARSWPGDIEPAFRCRWTIQDTPVKTKESNNGKGLIENVVLSNWNCYDIELEIMDDCGRTMKASVSDVPVAPPGLECPSPPRYNSFIHPMPDPGATRAVVGLNRLPQEGGPRGNGTFEGIRPLEFKMLVVPNCWCDPASRPDCEAVDVVSGEPPDFMIQLVAIKTQNQQVISHQILASSLTRSGNQYGPEDPHMDGNKAGIYVEDLCEGNETGLKYFMVRIEDLGKVPVFLNADPGDFYTCYFAAKTLRFKGQSVNEEWSPVGRPFKLGNYPTCIDNDKVYWDGSYDVETDTYNFTVKLSGTSQVPLWIGSAPPIDLPLVGEVAQIPSLKSEMNAGLVTRFKAEGGQWLADVAIASTSGLLLSNQINGAPAVFNSTDDGGGGGLPGGGQLLDSWKWCREEDLFNYGFEEKLFESILYSGFVGPIPVTIRGAVSFGLNVSARAIVDAEITPFAALGGGGPLVTQDFYFLSNARVYVPCSATADALLGVASISLQLVPSAEFYLRKHLGYSSATGLSRHSFQSAKFNLDFGVEACLDLWLTEICYDRSVRLINGVDIMPFQNDGFNWDQATAGCEGGGGSLSGSGGSLRQPGGGGRGGGPIVGISRIFSSTPATAVSPDGETIIYAFQAEKPNIDPHTGKPIGDPEWSTAILVAPYSPDDPQAPFAEFILTQRPGELEDPAVVFLTNDLALVAWKKTAPEEAEDLPPPPPGKRLSLEITNKIAATKEIVVIPAIRIVDDIVDEWAFNPAYPIMDWDDGKTDRSQWRADGKPSLASASKRSSLGALVAWVRYRTQELLIEEAGLPEGYLHPVEQADGTHKLYTMATLDPAIRAGIKNVRPKLENTVIYVRWIDGSGIVAGKNPVRLSPDFDSINIEPDVFLTPSGDVGYCVWIHDPVNTDLLRNNRGRHLFYSRYDGQAGTWSAAADAFPNPDRYPGMLEPSIALREHPGGYVTGYLAFTALQEGASSGDSGFGGANRYVFVSYLDERNPTPFTDPIRIHEKCRDPMDYTYFVEFLDPPADEEYAMVDIFGDILGTKKPETFIYWQRTGPLGSQMGAGDFMVSAFGRKPIPGGGNLGSRSTTGWSRPINLTPGDRVISNIAAAVSGTALSITYLDGGSSIPEEREAAGVEDYPTFRRVQMRLEPDLAIVSCRIDDPYATPGAPFTGTFVVENRGLTGSPVDDQGQSVAGLKFTVIREDHSQGEDEVLLLEVPELAPGESTEILVDATMPLDPILVKVELDPNPWDRDLTNNTCEVYLGVPTPADVTCETVALPAGEEVDLAARLAWFNRAPYDEILIYKENSLFTVLPGSATSFVDRFVEEGEEYTYAVRASIRAARSDRASKACKIEPPEIPGEPEFRRGDVDGNGIMELTDVIRFLNYQFVGTIQAIDCRDAADIDDSGDLDLTDAIRSLNFQFAGTAGAPEPPGPYQCGIDPTVDALDCKTSPCP